MKYWRISLVSTLVIVICASRGAALPTVIGQVESHSFTQGSGQKPSIAVDSANRPHIAAARDPMLLLFDKLPSGWTEADSISLPPLGSAVLHNPNIEIANDVAWVSGLTFSSGQGPWALHGMGICARGAISSDDPTSPTAGYSVRHIAGAWDSGTISVNPDPPYEAVITTAATRWQSYTYTPGTPGNITYRAAGQMYSGAGGEKNMFYISKPPASPVAHAGTGYLAGTHQVWHGGSSGYGREDSLYQNSERYQRGLPPVAWAAYSAYPGMGDDGAYLDITSDSADGRRAYISWWFGSAHGVVINIYNPDTGTMLFPTSSLKVVDAAGSSGQRRFAPQVAPDKTTGAWISWTSRGGVYVRYISPDGQLGDEYRVGNGERANICVDSKGFLHLVYSNGNLQYRKIEVTGASGGTTTMPIDFDGDGADDLGIYDSATGKWWGKKATADGKGQVLLAGTQWGGWPTVVPVPGNYHGTAAPAGISATTILDTDEIAVFDSYDGRWFHNPPSVTPQSWGYRGVMPVQNDYDGDGLTDLAVFDPTTAQWWIQSVSKGPVLVSNNVWGARGFIPVPADYDGDGICDLGVYDPATYRWHIRTVAGTIIAQNINWGYAGIVPVALNYDDDPEFELGAYDAKTGLWHIMDTPSKGDGRWFNVPWGFPGTLPAPANYDGDRGNKWELGVYQPSTGNWYVRGVNNTTPANWGWAGGTAVPLGAH